MARYLSFTLTDGMTDLAKTLAEGQERLQRVVNGLIQECDVDQPVYALLIDSDRQFVRVMKSKAYPSYVALRTILVMPAIPSKKGFVLLVSSSIPEQDWAAWAAHELGHVVHRDLSRLNMDDVVSFSILGCFVYIWILVIGSHSWNHIPTYFLVACFIGILVLILHFFDRREERRADDFACDLVGPEVYVQTLSSDPEESALCRALSLIGTHPSTASRIKRAQARIPVRIEIEPTARRTSTLAEQ